MRRSYSDGSEKMSAGLGLIAVALIACTIFGSFLYVNGTRESVTCTVQKMERVTTGSGDSVSSKYLVFTDGETFENTDCIWVMKFNSSDLYGQLRPDTRYKMEVYGWRVPWCSWYRNIISAKRVSEVE